MPLAFPLHIKPEFDSQGTSLGILSRLPYQGESDGVAVLIGRIATKVEARCVSQTLKRKGSFMNHREPNW